MYRGVMTNVVVSSECSLGVEQQSLINLQTYNIPFHRILYFFIFQVTLVFTLASLHTSYIFIDGSAAGLITPGIFRFPSQIS